MGVGSPDMTILDDGRHATGSHNVNWLPDEAIDEYEATRDHQRLARPVLEGTQIRVSFDIFC